jgi:hypothetical protein
VFARQLEMPSLNEGAMSGIAAPTTVRKKPAQHLAEQAFCPHSLKVVVPVYAVKRSHVQGSTA